MSKLAWSVVIGGVLLAVLLLISNLITPFVWGRDIGGYRYGWGMMGGFGFPGMGMMGLGMMVFWVLVVVGIVSFVQPLKRRTGSGWIPPRGESAFDILQRRYSRGEITKEQYESMKRDLGLAV